MQVDDQLRIDMLDVVKNSIEDGSADHKIIFKNEAGDPLAEVVFQHLDVAGVAQYKFIALDNTAILRAVVIEDGRVVQFSISGMAPTFKALALLGNVGTLATTADIRFNKLDWSEGASITINELVLYVKQGA